MNRVRCLSGRNVNAMGVINWNCGRTIILRLMDISVDVLVYHVVGVRCFVNTGRRNKLKGKVLLWITFG